MLEYFRVYWIFSTRVHYFIVTILPPRFTTTFTPFTSSMYSNVSFVLLETRLLVFMVFSTTVGVTPLFCIWSRAWPENLRPLFIDSSFIGRSSKLDVCGFCRPAPFGCGPSGEFALKPVPQPTRVDACTFPSSFCFFFPKANIPFIALNLPKTTSAPCSMMTPVYHHFE